MYFRIIFILCVFFPSPLFAECSVKENGYAMYNRHLQLSSEPITEDGKVVGYARKEMTKEQKAEARECLIQAVENGYWEAANYLSEMYRTGKYLGFEKNTELYVKYRTYWEKRYEEQNGSKWKYTRFHK
jgi:hypothetical protein